MHAGLAAGRWQTMPFVAQMANVGSEVQRALVAQSGGKPERRDRAVARALELFDLSAGDARWRGHRRREILRARELFCSQFYSDPPTPGDAAFLGRYFLQFAVAARGA